jgi:fatty-acid desaturase
MLFRVGPLPLLAIVQIIAHLSVIPMIMWAKPSQYLIAMFVYFLTMCFGMSMTYHRLLSHQSWHAPKWFRAVGLFLGTYGITGSSITWVAIHRQHHEHTDDKKDPHSPLQSHWLKVQFMSMLPTPNILKYAKDLSVDPLQKIFHRYYWQIHLSIVAALFFIDPFAIVYAYLFPAAILWNMGSAINTMGHMQGYRNFDTKDSSKNNILLGYLTCGEGWHNNHHKNPRKANYGEKPWEFDLAGIFIKIFNKTKQHS